MVHQSIVHGVVQEPEPVLLASGECQRIPHKTPALTRRRSMRACRCIIRATSCFSNRRRCRFCSAHCSIFRPQTAVIRKTNRNPSPGPVFPAAVVAFADGLIMRDISKPHRPNSPFRLMRIRMRDAGSTVCRAGGSPARYDPCGSSATSQELAFYLLGNKLFLLLANDPARRVRLARARSLRISTSSMPVMDLLTLTFHA